MFDSCRRDIHYLRLSVTDRCNLRCRYCMPDGAKIPEHEEVLRPDLAVCFRLRYYYIYIILRCKGGPFS